MQRITFGSFALFTFLVIGVACDDEGSREDGREQDRTQTTTGQKEDRERATGSSSSEKTGKTSADADDTATGTPDATADVDPALLKPDEANARAPSTFRVKFNTTEGPIVAEFHREWAPNGVDLFYNLVTLGYYEDVAFFRVIDGFMAQFGLHGSPAVNQAWQGKTIKDDPVEKSNERGYISFAKRPQPDSRTTQLFINYRDNAKLDEKNFAPIGKVVEGMDVVDALYAGYEGGISQKKIRNRGNAFLEEQYPKLDYIESTKILEESK